MKLRHLSFQNLFLTPDDWKHITYFYPEEFVCPCIKHKRQPVYDMSAPLVHRLVVVREYVSMPIIITSGWRCKKHNTEVGGHPNSPHLLKVAVDITIPNITYEKLVKLYLICEHVGFRGIGIYPMKRFIHVDVSNRVQRWLYNETGTYVYLFPKKVNLRLEND